MFTYIITASSFSKSLPNRFVPYSASYIIRSFFTETSKYMKIVYYIVLELEVNK